MKALIAIASGTFKEGARSRLFWGIVIFAIAMLLSSIVLSEFTFAERYKIVADFGLSFISLFGILVAIFVGVELIHREMDKRTIYVILSKPIRRSSFVFGRYLGLLGIVFVNFVLMTVFLYVLLYLYAQAPDIKLLAAIYGSFLQVIVIAASALFFSVFTSPFIAAFATIGIYIIGHSIDILRGAAAKQTGITSYILNLTATIFPDLSKFDLKVPVVYGEVPPSMTLIFMFVYCLGYALLLMILATIIFERKEFK
ncbi:MAG: hypothetical protein DRQ10_05395 [Candidatus Hydrothermota bacterium]|nr:MAG: hypothetical protein DRQ10_05395 [Candidatus Hydrothermae bacterium]